MFPSDTKLGDVVQKWKSQTDTVIPVSSTIHDKCIPTKKRPCENDNRPDAGPNINTVYFLQRGKAMSKSRINILSAAVHKSQRLRVVQSFDQNDPPRYLILDDGLSAEYVSIALGYSNLHDMAKCFHEVSE